MFTLSTYLLSLYVILFLVWSIFKYRNYDKNFLKEFFIVFVFSFCAVISENNFFIHMGWFISLYPFFFDGVEKKFLKTIYLSFVIIAFMVGIFWVPSTETYFIDQNNSHGQIFYYLIFFSVVVRLGVFPFHGYLIQHVEKKNFPSLLFVLNPLSMKVLIEVTESFAIHESPLKKYMVPYLALSSLYFAFLLIQEKKMTRIVLYSYLALIPAAVIGVFSLREGELEGVCFFYTNLAIAVTGIALSFSSISQKIGVQKITEGGGLISTFPLPGYIFLVFSFFLANVPLSLGFLGEDIVLSSLLKYSLLSTVLVLVSFSIVGIALYKIYISVFCGQNEKNYPPLYVSRSEKMAYVFLIVVGSSVSLFPHVMMTYAISSIH